jgi:hypothetical protein
LAMTGAVTAQARPFHGVETIVADVALQLRHD